jgi:putative ABC transport system permease protein
VVGIAAQVTIQAYDGDASWVGYPMISGRWYATADEVVASSYLLRQTGHHVGDQVTIVGDTGQRRVTIVGECLDGDNDLSLIAGTATLTGVTPAPVLDSFAIGLRTGTSPATYTDALNDALGTESRAYANDLTQDSDSETFIIINGLIATLALLLCTVAALGVFNTVVLNTRERIHEIGVLKAVGMTPRQVRAMVLTSMAGLGVFAGVLAVPAGVLLQHRIVPIMANAAGTGLPRSFIDVYGPGELVALGCAGIVLAAIGALIPAGWASRTRVANALRAE